LLNSSKTADFEELVFWGRVDGIKNDYYIAMGVTYTDKFEFPEKRFYWATSADFKFKSFPELNDQNSDKFDTIKGLLIGDPNLVHIRVVAEKSEEEVA